MFKKNVGFQANKSFLIIFLKEYRNYFTKTKQDHRWSSELWKSDGRAKKKQWEPFKLVQIFFFSVFSETVSSLKNDKDVIHEMLEFIIGMPSSIQSAQDHYK